MLARPSSRWLLVLLGLGLYLSIRGYESRDGDQAYRLPLLLHRQDPALYANDPFVRAFDTFNPHAGYLDLLDVSSRALGLSAALLVLFSATFGLTAVGIDRLARLAWPESGGRAGILAVVLVMATRAGNIGTNHLFEPVLLDRLIALALGWNALACALERPERGAWKVPIWVSMAMWVHPSLGLQLGMLLGSTWVAIAVLSFFGSGQTMETPSGWRSGFVPATRPRAALLGLALLGLAMLPRLMSLPLQAEALLRGMSPEDFLLYTARVQSPQHMLPHLWRSTQWAAWFGFLALAGLSLLENRQGGRSARSLLWSVLGISLLGLVLGWFAIERLHLWKVTVFQPFRMASVTRGLALILVAGRANRLWTSGTWLGTVRVALMVCGLTSDLAFVVVVLAEIAFAVGEWSFRRSETSIPDFPAGFLGLGALGLGLIYLDRVQTDASSARIALGLAVGLGAGVLRRLPLTWTTGRRVRVLVMAWMLPVFSMLAPRIWTQEPPRWVAPILDHCRMTEDPSDSSEKLALWTRREIPSNARLVVPPGEKTFRLWSRHSVSFNRAASPYHAEGLLDWSRRYRDHVGFEGSAESFATLYLRDHVALERRYDDFSSTDLADLARRQRAAYVIASSFLDSSDGSLLRLHSEGKYAIYRVAPRPDVAFGNEAGAIRK